MTPKEGNTSKLSQKFMKKIILATLTKRISTTGALAAANMTLFIQGPSPHISGVCILSYLLFISISIILVTRNRD
jgi:hypothetical protein